MKKPEKYSIKALPKCEGSWIKTNPTPYNRHQKRAFMRKNRAPRTHLVALKPSVWVGWPENHRLYDPYAGKKHTVVDANGLEYAVSTAALGSGKSSDHVKMVDGLDF